MRSAKLSTFLINRSHDQLLIIIDVYLKGFLYSCNILYIGKSFSKGTKNVSSTTELSTVQDELQNLIERN